jgi:hypothetical protein
MRMKALRQYLLAILLPLLLGVGMAQASDLGIELEPDQTNPVNPTMGDAMHFHSAIHNGSACPIKGLVAWVSLVEVTPGREQPMDLEDWSAHKAVAGPTLGPGASLTTDWPMRVIQSGDYRVVISTTDRNEHIVYTSPTLQFPVARKPVVESSRILPVALGLPLSIGGVMAYRGWQQRRRT